MKLLTEVSDITEFYRLKLLLESNGILIHVGNEDTARNFGFFHPVGKYAIHVVYEEQLDDAIKLMEDENHIVVSPLDIEEIKNEIQENQSAANTRLLNIVLKAAVVTIIAVACLLWMKAVLNT